jgi:hypothetical protein
VTLWQELIAVQQYGAMKTQKKIVLQVIKLTEDYFLFIF